MNIDQTETVVFAQNIISMRNKAEQTTDRALLLAEGKIAEVVPAEVGRRLVRSGKHSLNFPEQTLIPSFIDPHAHTEVAALTQFGVVDVRVPRCKSISEVLQRLRLNLTNLREGWLIAQGNLFYDRKLADGRFPTRDELDMVSREIPIIIRAGGHLSILNSKALELSGIGSNFIPPSGSVTGTPVVKKDSNGVPTGILLEMDNLIPFPRPQTHELLGALESGVSDLFTQFGVTTIGEISETVAGLQAFSAGISNGSISARLNVYLWVPGTVSLTEAIDREFLNEFAHQNPKKFSITGVKVFADGGFSAAQAGLSKEYVHAPGNCGNVALSSEEIEATYCATQQAGLQLAIHANGDRAQQEVCAALARARKSFGDHPGVRIEHAGNYVPNYDVLAESWKRAGIIPVPQPIFIRNFGEFVPDYVGVEAWNNQFPFRKLLDNGWPISGSSDVWVGSDENQSNPFRSMAATMDRLTFHSKVLDADEAITPWEALWMHTTGGANALGRAHELGALKPGAYADFSILDRNPLTCDIEDLESTQVTDIFFDGAKVTPKI